MQSPVVEIYKTLVVGKTSACATVVPVLQLRVLRDKWYHSEVIGAVTVRQLKGNREKDLRVIYN